MRQGGMITPAQCRAARGLLNWTQDDLAKAANVGIVTVRKFEAGNASPRNSTLVVVSQALEAAGCIFIAENGEGPGVRLRKSSGRQGAHAMSTQIAALEAKIADMPTGGEPSPEGGMNTMRKAVAENDLVHLKGRRTKSKRK